MPERQTLRIKCADTDCRAVYEVLAISTPSVQQTNYTICPSCGEEMRVNERGYHGNWAVDNQSRVVVGKW